MRANLFLLLCVTACLIVALLSTACTASPEVPSVDAPAAPAPAAEQIALRLTTWATGGLIAEMLDSWSSENYLLLHESVPVNDYWNRLLSESAAGIAPDLMWMSPNRVSSFVDAGYLSDIPNQCPEIEIEEHPDFAIRAFQRNGGTYSLPWDMNLRVLYINKDRFDEAGLSYPPQTWDELLEAAHSLAWPQGTNEEIQFGFALYGFGASGACYDAGSFAPCPFDWRTQMRQGALPMVIDWASMDYDQTDQNGNNIYGQNIVAYSPPVYLDGRWATTVGFTGTGVKAAPTNPDPLCVALQDLSDALRSSTGFFFTQSECDDQEKAVERVMNTYSKSAESAQNIVSVACNLTPDSALPWDVIGDAIPVPGDPVIQEAADALNGQLLQNGPEVSINVDRAVMLSNVHSAPIDDPNISDDEFWSTAASQGFIVGADVIPDDNEIEIPGGAYAVRIRGTRGEERIEYVDPNGEIYYPPYLGSEPNPYPGLGPYAGIRYGSENCTKCFIFICWTCRCR